MSGNDQVSARMCGEVARNRRLKIQSRFHVRPGVTALATTQKTAERATCRRSLRPSMRVRGCGSEVKAGAVCVAGLRLTVTVYALNLFGDAVVATAASGTVGVVGANSARAGRGLTVPSGTTGAPRPFDGMPCVRNDGCGLRVERMRMTRDDSTGRRRRLQIAHPVRSARLLFALCTRPPGPFPYNLRNTNELAGRDRYLLRSLRGSLSAALPHRRFVVGRSPPQAGTPGNGPLARGPPAGTPGTARGRGCRPRCSVPANRRHTARVGAGRH